MPAMMKYRPEYDAKIIGKNLKRLREAKNLSVKYVQEYLRLGSPQAYYKYEKGDGYPQADTLLALMDLYDAERQDITEDHEVVREVNVEYNQYRMLVETFEMAEEHSITDCKKDVYSVRRERMSLLNTDGFYLCETRRVLFIAIISIEKYKRGQAKQLKKYYEVLRCNYYMAGRRSATAHAT